MKCSTLVQELIDSTDDIGQIDRIINSAEYKRALKKHELRAKRTHSYAAPSERIEPYIGKTDKLIGQSLMFEATNNGKAHFEKVKNARMIAPSVVAINDDSYKINLDQGITTDGLHYVTIDKSLMGSAKTRRITAPKMNEINGTVVANLDEVIAKTIAEDGDKLDPSFKEYLNNVFNTYKDVLLESGKDVPIDVEFFKALDNEEKAYGDANPENGKIRLLLGNTKDRTHTEILAEELQHILIRSAIQNNDELRYEIEQFKDAMIEEFNNKYNGEGYKLFLEDIENPTEDEIKVAKKQWEYAFENTEWPVDEFLAHATTNKTLIKALMGVEKIDNIEVISPVSEVDKNGKPRRWAKIWNTIVKTINQVYSSMKTNDTNSHEYAVSLLTKLLEIEHKARREEDKSRYEKLLDKISNTDRRIAKITEQIDGEYKTYQEMIENTKTGKIKQIVNKIWKIRGLAKARSIVLQNNIFSSLSRNMRNPDIAKFYEMYRHSKEFVEKEVVAVRQRTAKLLGHTHELEKLSLGERHASKRVIVDADAKALGSSKEIITYLEDPNKVDNTLTELTKEFSKQVIMDIDNTANLLVHNTSNSVNVFTNANQIAYERLAKVTNKTIENLDKAITLRALQKLSTNDKKMALDAIRSNPKGFDFAMGLMKEEQEQILKKAYKGNKLYVTKGAKQEHFRKDKKRYLVDAEEMEALSKAKIHNLGKHEELSALLGKDIYVMMGDSLDTRYTEGLLKVVQLSNEGDSLKYLMEKLGEHDEKAIEVKLELLRKHKGHAETTLVPERGGMGQIYDYRVRIPHEDKVAYMELDNDIITTVASTVSNLTHKQEAMLSNHASLSYLNRFHEMYKDNPDFDFVEIGPKSEGKFKKYWDMLPYYIKNEIKNSGTPLMVTDGMLTDYFGYHDVSVINAPWIKSSKKRQLMAKKMESIIMEVIRHWKLRIVAFTGSTVAGNNLSNMAIALQYTSFKNPITYMNKYRKVWGMMNDYQKMRKERIDLDLKRKAGTKGLDRKIKALDARMEANPVHAVVEDGQYSVIFEDLNTAYFDNEGIVEGKINEIIKKAEGKNGRNILKSVVDTIYTRKDSAIHDSVMKATTYSDVVNKVIILMDAKEQAQRMRKEKRSNKIIGEMLFGASENAMDKYFKTGAMPKAWLNGVDLLHVNYGYLDNRYIKYANDMGGLTFTKYFFRVLPAMAKMIATKGLTVALTETAQAATKIDIETPLDQYFDPMRSLLNKTSLYSRPENIFETIFYGPAINAVR